MVSGGSQSSESQSVPVIPRPFQQLQQPFADVLRQFLGPLTDLATGDPAQQAAQAAQAGGQSLTAPVGQQQTDLISQIVSAVSGGGPAGAATGQAADLLSQTLSGQFLPGQQNANPFLNAMFEAAARPVRSEFEDVIVPQLLSRFTGAGQQVQGQGSSAFALQANRAAEAQGKAISDLSANIFGPAFEAERQRQTEAITQASQLSEQQVSQLMQGLQAASLPQLTQDLGIQRGLEEFQNRVSALLIALQTLAGITTPQVGQQSESSGFQLGLFSK